MKNQNGFTLIELMIVIAIIGILLAIAIPAYQDYTVRAKVTECLNGLAPNKTGISEFVLSNGRFPTAIGSVGAAFDSKFCNASTYASTGVITIANSATAGVAAGTITLTLTPNTNSSGVNWTCTASGQPRYAPSSCR